MPISEDEYDSRQEFEQDDRQSSTLSKAELRKVCIFFCIQLKLILSLNFFFLNKNNALIKMKIKRYSKIK